jgi:ketosteroid isomerase-like protein
MESFNGDTGAGVLPTLLSLMAEDVVFLTPGRPPIHGREAFAVGAQQGQGQYQIAATGEVQELLVSGDWASC